MQHEQFNMFKEDTCNKAYL